MTNDYNGKKPLRAGGFSARILAFVRNLKSLFQRNFRERRYATLAVLALLLLIAYRLMAGYAAVFGFGVPGGKPAEAPVYVQLGEATRGVMREVGHYYGTLTAAQRFTVAPRVGGELQELLVDIGDSIESGDMLARLDAEEHGLARDRAAHNVRLAEAQYAETQANLELAKSDMARQASLSEKRIVTQSEFEAAENKLKQAEARHLVAQSQLSGYKSELENAELTLSYSQVSALWPEGGRRYVAERLADVGDLLTPNTPIFSVVSLNPLIVVVEVIERDYPKIKMGQEAELRIEAWPGEVFKARVIRIAPVLSDTSRQGRVELEVQNPDLRLKPGMFADLAFVFKETGQVWSVPSDIPFRQADGFVIFVADPKTLTVKMLPVTLGLVDEGRVELLDSPPIEGPIITLGQHLLEDGQGYRLPEEPGAEAEK